MRKFLTSTDRILPVHHPRVLVETAVMHGADRSAVLERSGLTPEMLASADMRVSPMEYSVLCANALRLTRERALGLRVGRNIGPGQLGMLGLLFQNSPTLGGTLAKFLEYSSLIAPAWQVTLDFEGSGAAVLTFNEVLALGTLRRFLHEVTLASFDTIARSLIGGTPIPVRRLEYPFADRTNEDLYRELFYDVPIAFGAPVARVVFDAAVLETPIALADPATAEIAEQVVAQQTPPDMAQGGLIVQVRRILASEAGAPRSPAEMARALQTSTRTLRRELEKMNTSYSQIVDESRRERARAWVETNSMPLELLAERLGFSTVGSFRRAFKRWTGRTPAEYRSRPRKSA